MILRNFKEKLSKLKNRLFSSYLVKNIFTKVNFSKFLIIFTVGVISRAFVNNICGINVYVDFLHYISILYYIAFSIFIVVVHDIASSTGFSLISVFKLDFLDFIISKIKLVLESFTKLVYTTTKNSILLFSKLKYEEFKISYIRKVIRDSSFNFNDKMYLEDLSYEKDISHNNRDTLLKTYVLNKNKDSSSNRLSSDRHPSSGNSRSNSSYNGGNRNTDSLTRRNNNIVQSTRNNIDHNNLLFVVDTFNDGRGSRALASPAPSVAPSENQNYSFTYATLPNLAYVPNNSPIPQMPRAPVPSNLSTPSTMTPLFPSQENINYKAPNNQGVANNTNTRYSNSNYSNSIASTSAMAKAPNNTNTRYNYSNGISRALLDEGYPIPGQAAYYNPPRSSTGTDKFTLGLNASNERL